MRCCAVSLLRRSALMIALASSGRHREGTHTSARRIASPTRSQNRPASSLTYHGTHVEQSITNASGRQTAQAHAAWLFAAASILAAFVDQLPDCDSAA